MDPPLNPVSSTIVRITIRSNYEGLVPDFLVPSYLETNWRKKHRIDSRKVCSILSKWFLNVKGGLCLSVCMYVYSS